jgi:Skp family chaperone for outer membrane proteins
LTAALLAVVPAASAQEGPARIAVVDLELVVSQSVQGKALQTRLEQFQSEARASLEAKSGEMQTLQRQLAEGASSLSESRIEELQKQIEEVQIAARRQQDDKQREGQKIQTEGLRAIEKAIAPVLAQIRDDMGLDLILNNVPGVVVLAGSRLDITQEVVDRLATAGS